jgi:uncharacterized repeat protein (TIGR03803 family)
MRRLNGRLGAVAVMTALTAVILAETSSAPAQTFTTLVTFNYTNGDGPSGLTQATNGNLVGAAGGGGAFGGGLVFSITPAGKMNTLYSFCAQNNCTDGGGPSGAVVQGTDGNFYGTTAVGGSGGNCFGGCGTIFKITPEGILTTLHAFSGTDGETPETQLLLANDGDFYGTTLSGGANDNAGTVFKITSNGVFTLLYSFCSLADCVDGDEVDGTLVQGTDGDFYGTTAAGGAYANGTIFKITSNGALSTLYSFCSQPNCADGGYPEGGLVQGPDHYFYGTTYGGGTSTGCRGYACGTVFKFASNGTLTTLDSFDFTDGEGPNATLIQATDGNLYGTTEFGGSNQHGTIFRVSPAGKLTTLYNFCSLTNCTDGASPATSLVQDTSGTLYGTTSGYSSPNDGTLFSLTEDLNPFVETLPPCGSSGTSVFILGTNLARTSSVTFNGTTAAFTVVSNSEIKTTVPTGATTGRVNVTTPVGTLTSNVNFQVQP